MALHLASTALQLGPPALHLAPPALYLAPLALHVVPPALQLAPAALYLDRCHSNWARQHSIWFRWRSVRHSTACMLLVAPETLLYLSDDPRMPWGPFAPFQLLQDGLIGLSRLRDPTLLDLPNVAQSHAYAQAYKAGAWACKTVVQAYKTVIWLTKL